MFFSLASLFALCAVAAAQTTHNILVGETGLTYTPNQITAGVGDIVAFEFHPKNHTLTQSTFANPCTPMAGGADSGFMPVAAASTTFPVYSFKINQVTPLWFFCAQATHCHQGMVFAINVNTTSPNSFAAFQANAMGGGAAAATASALPTTATAAQGGVTPVATSGVIASALPSVLALTSVAPAATNLPSGGSMLSIGRGTTVLLGLVGIAIGLLA